MFLGSSPLGRAEPSRSTAVPRQAALFVWVTLVCGRPGDLAGDSAGLESWGLSWACQSGGGGPQAAGCLLGVAQDPTSHPPPSRPSPFTRQMPHLGVHIVWHPDQDPAVARSALHPADGGHPCPASQGAGVEGWPGGWADGRPAPPKPSPHGRLGHPAGCTSCGSGSRRWVKGFCSLGRGSHTGS